MTDLLLIAGPILIAALGLLATPWGLPVLSWLVGNPVGRIVALIGIAIAATWIAFQIGRRDGVQRIEAQQAKQRLDSLQDRIAVDETIRKMPADKRREELAKWIR